MSDDNGHTGPFHNEPPRSEFPQLVARHHQLVHGLRESEDPVQRSELSQELRRVRQQIAEITGSIHPTQSELADNAEEPREYGRHSAHQPSDDEFSNTDYTSDDYTDFSNDDDTDFSNDDDYAEFSNPDYTDFGNDEYSNTDYTDTDLSGQQIAYGTDEAANHQDPDQTDQQHPPAQPLSLPSDDRDYGAYAEHPYPADTHADDSLPQQPYFEDPIEQYTWHDPGETMAGRDDSTNFVSQTAVPAASHPISSPDAVDHRELMELGPRQEGDDVGSSLVDYYRSIRPSGMVLAVVGVCLVALAGLLWFGGGDRTGDTAAEQPPPASPTSEANVGDSEADAVVANVRAILMGLGLSNVVVDHRDGIIHLGGPVPSQADFDAAVTAAQAVAAGFTLETSGLVTMPAGESEPAPAPTVGTGRPAALQAELDRILASTPLIFASGEAELTELHQRILNNVVLALSAYPGLSLTIAGYTDELGNDTSNQDLSLARAEGVRQYLIAAGQPVEAFNVEARGEAAASVAALAGLERRVELEVNGAMEPVPEQAATVRVAIVAPSASNDLAFTQSMVDAVNLLATETPLELSVTDNTFVPDEAAAAVRGYAEQGYDLIIAHGSQFGASLIEIAPQFPETAFAWGTASDTFGLPNVYAYDAAAQQGGYVLGAIAAMASKTDVIGVVGPIEVGDAALFVNGFSAGAKAQKPPIDVRVTYTGSFSDTGLAAEAANGHLGAGADVLTGSAQMVVGAVAAAQQSGALWFGTQANQTSLAPGSVVASQVYHWEIALRPIIQDIRTGTMAGDTYTADLANGGLVIEYNSGLPLAAEIRQRADQLVAAIVDGTVIPPG